MASILIQVYASEKSQNNMPLKIFQAENKLCEVIWYIEKDNKLYISIGYNNTPESNLYEYEDRELIKIPMTLEEEDKFRDGYEVLRIANPAIKKKDLGNNKYLILKIIEDTYSDYLMTIEENGKEKDISKNRYILYGWKSYAYIDKEFQKIYMVCRDVKKKLTGLFVYDIIKDTFREFPVVKIDDNKSITYLNPIRIPNTPYLMMLGEKTGTDWGMYIEEIPEWKEEIERQEKNKKENPTAKAAYTNGSANVRDNPKGKVISTLNDWTEVLILEQENDWYHILHADIEGWTYKDNIRQAEK
jgi:hypothetical protein